MRHTNGSYRAILYQAKALNVSHDGKIQTVIRVQTDVAHLNPPIRNRISFISRKKPNIHFEKQGGSYLPIDDVSNLFTKREKEIMTLI